MARPRQADGTQKIKLTLTVSPDVKEMCEIVRKLNNKSLSVMFEDVIKKEYRRAVKNGIIKDTVCIPGQTFIEQFVDGEKEESKNEND